MTLKQLEYFLSCATLLNFRKAAQLHYISPPTLTRQISALEEELGTPLFIRNSHGMQLTHIGWVFFHSAYRMLTEYQHFYDQTNMSGIHLQRQGNPFLIGSYAFDGMYGELVDRILALPDFFLDRPIKIDFIDAGCMIRAVMNGDIEIGIDSEVHVRKHGDLFRTKLLQTIPFDVVVGPANPLAQRKTITHEELFTCFTDTTVFPMEGRTYPAQIQFPIDSPDTLRKIGEFNIESLPELFSVFNPEDIGSRVIGILPQTLCAARINELHRIEIEGNPCTTNYCLFWRKDNANPDIAKFIRSI